MGKSFGGECTLLSVAGMLEMLCLHLHGAANHAGTEAARDRFFLLPNSRLRFPGFEHALVHQFYASSSGGMVHMPYTKESCAEMYCSSSIVMLRGGGAFNG